MFYSRKVFIPVIVALSVVFLQFSRVFSSEKNINVSPEKRINGNIFSYSSLNRKVILIEKKTDRLFLVNIQDNTPVIVSEYPVVTGQNNGDKLREGDQRTPEGIYFIQKYIPPEKLNTLLFGDGAFPINYPNLVDRIHGKTGHGIWIHGRGKLTNGRRTNGCISLSNKDLGTLKEYLMPGFPVVITEELDFMPPEEYKKEKERYLRYLRDFISAWQNNDFTSFKKFFSRSFRSSWNETYDVYLERKKRLMLQYPEKDITLKDIILYKENSRELMYEYKQLYCTRNYIDFGLKRLYLEGDSNGQYSIIGEEFSKLPVVPEIKGDVIDFINKWLSSWKKQDIKSYISFYSADFRHGSMDLNKWREYKESVFKKSDIKDIQIENITIQLVSGGRIKAHFIQDYQSDILADRGIKTLIIEGCPKNYRIIQEYWKPL